MWFRRWWRVLIVVIAAAVVLGGWLAASPHGSSPDDDWHLASIWCADVASGEACIVPEGIAGEPCYARQRAVGAACHAEALATSTATVPTDWSNVHGLRPNLYYRVMALFIVDDLSVSVALMRLANVIVGFALFWMAWAVADAPVRQAMALSTLIVSVPLGLFIVTSTNTGAWGIAGFIGFWSAFATLVRADRRRARLWMVWSVLGLSFIVAAGSRIETVAYMLVAVIALWGADHLSPPPQWKGVVTVQRLAIAGGVVVGIGLIALAVVSTSTVGRWAIDRVAGQAAAGFPLLRQRTEMGNPFLYNTVELPLIWTGVFGHRGGRGSLGWLDTTMPPLVYVPMIAVTCGVVFAALGRASIARAWRIGIVGASLIAVPWFIFASQGSLMQENLQPRHFLGLVYLFVAVAVLADRHERLLSLSILQRGLVVIATSVAHAVALHVNLRRYTHGWDGRWILNLDREADWWWTSGVPSPMATWLLASLAFALVAFAATRTLSATKAS